MSPVGDFGTTEFVVDVLDNTDVGGDLAIGEDEANDFDVKLDFTWGDLVIGEVTVLVIDGDLTIPFGTKVDLETEGLVAIGDLVTV